MTSMNEEYVAMDRDILEYLMWVALEDILRLTDMNDGSFAEHARLSLHLVNLFSMIFARKTSNTTSEIFLDLRKSLLYITFQIHPRASQMIDLSSGQLEIQRERQRNRSLQFLSCYDIFNDLSLPVFTTSRSEVGDDAPPALLDVLPHFISLSATFFHAQKAQASTNWFTLAADFMAAAAAEYFLQHGAPEFNALAIAFSYGFSSKFLESCDDDREVAVASLFWEERTSTENPIWVDTRRNAIERLLPKPGTTFLDHLRDLDADPEHSRDQTLKNMRRMMKAFSNALPAPLLSSLGE